MRIVSKGKEEKRRKKEKSRSRKRIGSERRAKWGE